MKLSKRLICVGLAAGWLVSSLAGLSSPCAAADEPAVAQPAAADPLPTLNLASRALYHRARELRIARLGPVILLKGDALILRQGDQRTEVTFVPEEYHVLKTFSHVVLALDVLLMDLPDGSRLDQEIVAELEKYRALVALARDGLAQTALKKDQMDRQGEIVAAALSFIDGRLRAGSCPPQTRMEFTRLMSPLVLRNGADATRAVVDALDAQVRRWKSELKPDEWDRVSVIILGRQLPRRDNLAAQYFARLLGVRGECNRLIYAESISDESQALDLLGTHLVDTQIGIDFFNDPERMKRDLLGDAARDYIPRLFAEERP